MTEEDMLVFSGNFFGNGGNGSGGSSSSNPEWADVQNKPFRTIDTTTLGVDAGSKLYVKQAIDTIELVKSDLIVTFKDGTDITTDMSPLKIHEWDATTDYELGDIVIKDDKLYYCLVAGASATFVASNWQLIGASESDFSIVSKYSALPTTGITSAKIAYVLEDETVGTDDFKKGHYLYDVATTTWNRVIDEEAIHTNRDALDLFENEDIIDVDGITVIGKKIKYNNKVLAFEEDVPVMDSVSVYYYEVGKQYKKDVLVIKDGEFYKCLVEPQADANVFDLVIPEWEIVTEEITHTNRTTIDLLENEDIIDPTDNITVIGKKLLYDAKALAYEEDIPEVGDANIYYYKINTVFKEGSIVIDDNNVMYRAIQDTTDLSALTEVDFVMIHELPDTVEIYAYVSGTQYEVGDVVIKDDEFYECLVSPQVDATVFDLTTPEWKILSDKHELEANTLEYETLFNETTTVTDYKGDAEKVVSSEYLFNQFSIVVPKLLDKVEDIWKLVEDIHYSYYDTKADLDAVDLTAFTDRKLYFFSVKDDETHPRTDADGVDYYSTLYVMVPNVDDTTQNQLYFVAELNLSEKLIEAKIKKAINEAIYIYTVPTYYKSDVSVAEALEVVDDSTATLTGTQIKLSDVTPVEDGYTPVVGDYVLLVGSTKTDVTKFVQRDEIEVPVVSELSSVTETVDGADVEFLTFKGNKIATDLTFETENIDFDTEY